MALKLGHVILMVVMLGFFIGGFSTLLNELDRTTNQETYAARQLYTMKNGTDEGVRDAESGFTEKIDVTSAFGVEDNQEVDIRGQESGGLLNLFTKNVITDFVGLLQQKLFIPPIVTGLVLTLMGVLTTILLLRLFFGENKI